jgi:hypothetical protein
MVFITDQIFAQNEKYVKVKMDKVWDTHSDNIASISTSNPKSNWYKIYVPLENIPSGYDSVSQLFQYIDYDQVIYQAYKRGDIPYSSLNNFIQKWGLDTLQCTSQTINSYIRGIAGKKGDDWYYILDESGDGNLNDETPIKLIQQSDSLYSGKIHLVKFERFVNNQTVQDSTRILLTLASKGNEGIRSVFYRYLESRKGKLQFKNNDYGIALSANFNSFDYNYRTNVQILDSQSGEISGSLKKGNYFTLDSTLFYIESISKNGDEIIFTIVENKPKLISTQKDFYAPPIIGTTLDNYTVQLSDFQGSYTLLYFWNSTCEASTYVLEKAILPISSRLDSASLNLKIFGIALDFRTNIERFVKKKPLSWIQIVSSAYSKIKADYDIFMYPTIYLLDPNGVVLENSIYFSEALGEKIFSIIKDDVKQKQIQHKEST